MTYISDKNAPEVAITIKTVRSDLGDGYIKKEQAQLAIMAT